MRTRLMLNCHEATFLMAKKEEGKLRLIDRLKLTFHTSMCRFCRLFQRQARQISAESRQILSDQMLSPAFKDRMEQLINDNYQG